MKLIQLKQNEIKSLRKKLWMKQKKKCAILGQEINFEDAVLDHKHKLKKEKAGPNGKGLIRGVLHFQANALEGVIAKKFKRYGLHNFISLPKFLRRMADFIENPPAPQIYIHPSEKPKSKKLGKREYNRIKKYYLKLYPKRRTIPEYPKSGKLTKKWKDLLKAVDKLYYKKGK